MEKDKTKVVERLKKRIENYIPKKLESKSIEYQLGYMIGEYIVAAYLPTIDVYCHTSHTICVSEEDRLEYERLDNLWYENYNHGKNKNEAKEDWFNLRTFAMSLEKKYLPHILECRIYPIDVKNIIDLKQGIRDSLWDCDNCCYKIKTDDDIIIEKYEPPFYFSVVKLNLNMDYEIVY
ncbi:hypothetical protein M0Q97_09305 [Candidatus Dojkabacteria bacterium]|jgi:hypothetical protein|nr:hypothetical protein [Candidatus Dojkabacteria bacterium]